LWDLILDKRLNPLEDRAGEGGGLVMTDMSVKVAGEDQGKDDDVGNVIEGIAHSE
jgi:hypothetical protein